MTIEIVPYTDQHSAEVAAFNARIHAGGVTYTFPESSVPHWLPPSASTTIYQELFIALDGDIVRGGYILKHQEFVIDGETTSIGAFQLPLSEGTVDKAFAPVGVQLLRHALRRQPLLYTLGIGGYEEAAARLLVAAQFSIEKVPLYFQVEHPRTFLRQIRPLRTTRLRRLGCDIAAVTGLGSLGIRLLQRQKATGVDRSGLEACDVEQFDASVDDVWEAASHTFAFGAIRDIEVLRRLYDAPGNRFIRVVISETGRTRGWVVLLSTHGSGHKHFGDMTVGSIVDLLAEPGYEGALVRAAVDRLRQEDVDIIVSNQSLGSVSDALRADGFVSGPSNFLFAASPGLLARIGPLQPELRSFHFGRGDGDGPIHL